MSINACRKEIIEFLLECETLADLGAEMTGEGVQVAIVDSGIDATHPRLVGTVERSVVFTEDADGINHEEVAVGANDDAGHGTACAGIIHSIAPKASFIDLKVLGSAVIGTFAVLMEGIRHAIDSDIKLINMSLGTVKDQYIVPLLKMMQKAYEKDLIIVAAADNRRRTMYPSAFPSALSVDIGDAISSHVRIHRRMQNLIDYGGYGEQVETCGLNGTMVKMFGTSFATPHLTGLVALLLERWPQLSLQDVSFILNCFAEED